MAKESRVSNADIERVRREFEDAGLTTQQVADFLKVSKTYAHKLITKQGWRRASDAPILGVNSPKAAAGLFTENARAPSTRTPSPMGERRAESAPAAGNAAAPVSSAPQASSAPVPGAYSIPTPPADMTEWELRDWTEAECKKLLQAQNDRHAQELRVLQADFAAEARKPSDVSAARRQKTLAESTKIRHEMQRKNLEDWIRIKLMQLPVLAAGRGAVRIVVNMTTGFSIDGPNDDESVARRAESAARFVETRKAAEVLDVEAKDV
ncbi:hypothetical protein GNZ12_24110 [Paraburkholderia sp. 1N]|uniref:Phage terminase small subunit n=1 Tax=Paraburkholderia solitsugae TaxID=2675748 RepID=A0ABX2BWH7_9BURK|nr:hypothetical protein [Paraburkholderia solitsugae]NPT44338.1 hypothetical protein [Paraburkholderia solitsugae]